MKKLYLRNVQSNISLQSMNYQTSNLCIVCTMLSPIDYTYFVLTNCYDIIQIYLMTLVHTSCLGVTKIIKQMANKLFSIYC